MTHAWDAPCSLTGMNTAYGSAGDLVNTSVSLMVLNFIRNHPGGVLLAVLVLLAGLVLLSLYVARRVRLEALGYRESGRKAWTRVRSRLRNSPPDDRPDEGEDTRPPLRRSS
jgi:hypothetical protein